ncbi:MAG: NAD(P)/FAD-dependent oxidoreductase [Bacillota bacterium]|nr:NAD(P)/FAD-dependent oxidoreductase [Bacillota bacterium]
MSHENQADNDRYDAIIVGAGMGGLTTAAFLAVEGQKVLVLEKHDKPGGYLTSFSRGGYRFDAGLFHLNELGPDETISQFMRYWGEEVPAQRVEYQFRWFLGEREFHLDSREIEQSFGASFPAEQATIRRFFDLCHTMLQEIRRMGPPKPPYDMSLAEKLAFGVRSLIAMPTFLRFGRKDGVRVLRRLCRDQALASLLFGYYPVPGLIFQGHAWGWEAIKEGRNYYPVGGMQKIPDAVVRAIERHGGRVLLGTEARRIVVEGGQAKSVECTDGRQFVADVVVSNASLHHTLDVLLEDVPGLERLRKTVMRRKIFPSAMLVFLGMAEGYDFGGINHLLLLDNRALELRQEDLTPDNCPVALVVPPKPEGQAGHSALVVAFLPYEYRDCWATGGSGVRGERYRSLKAEVENILLGRIGRRLGSGFREAIRLLIAATPLTLERYTHSTRGSFMGWSMDERSTGHFIPQRSPITNLYLVGQWVFPAAGVPGVMAGGYYLAREILQREGINLEGKLTARLQVGQDRDERPGEAPPGERVK